MNRLHILVAVLAILSTFKVNAQDFLYQGLAFNFIPDKRDVELVALPDGKKYEGIVRIPSIVHLSDAILLRETDPNVRRKFSSDEMYSVVKIGDQAFKDCKKLISLTISDRYNDFDIGTEAVAGCNSLLEINFPNLMLHKIRIGDRAFMNSCCKRIHIPENVTEIGDSAFYGMKANSISFASSDDVKLGTAVFANSTIEYMDLPSGLHRIPPSTFRGCKNLKYIVLPESIFEIGANAFRDCKSLKYLTLPATLCHVRENAFSGVSLDGIAFNSFDKMKRAPRYLFSSICGRHIPDLIVFPAAKEKIYREWSPKMFREKIPVSLGGEGSVRISDKLIELEPGRVYPRSVLLQNVRKDFEANATVLVNKGSNLSIISIIKRHDGENRTAMVNDIPMELNYQNFKIKAYTAEKGYIEEWIIPYRIYMLQLKDIMSPITVNLDCE